MASLASFDPQELNLVDRALRVSEESVSDHYHLSDSKWLAYPYQVRTLADLEGNEVTGRALAQVLRFREPPRKGRLRSRDFFRICLQDHNLLGAVRREREPGLMQPLLTYVLTHELVHVVRFYQFQHLFEAFAHQREEEEAKVHAITARILGKTALPTMEKVLNLYRSHGGDLIRAAG